MDATNVMFSVQEMKSIYYFKETNIFKIHKAQSGEKRLEKVESIWWRNLYFGLQQTKSVHLSLTIMATLYTHFHKVHRT